LQAQILSEYNVNSIGAANNFEIAFQTKEDQFDPPEQVANRKVPITIYMDQTDAQEPGFSASTVQNVMNGWLSANKMSEITVNIVNGPAPSTVALGLQYGPKPPGWLTSAPVTGVNVQFHCYRGQLLAINSAFSILFIMVPGTYSGRANVAEFDAERDKVRDYPKTFAGCLIYEVFYHGQVKGREFSGEMGCGLPWQFLLR
jgi:hypothetical protein